MKQKIALVTGANNGMGLETALALVRKGIYVVMLCRNQYRGESAMEYIKTTTHSQDISLMLCDLGDMTDIRRFCDEFINTYGQLDILVNNAGVLNIRRQETKDGLEQHFGVCHIGHFLLTNLLLECMTQSARIVVVSSIAHKAGKINFSDLEMKQGYNVMKAYSRAKLCNVLFTKELARRIENKSITINCLHPGAVITNIGAKRSDGKTGIGMIRRIAGMILRPFVKTPAQGAATAVYLAVSDDCDGITGQYFADCKLKKSSKLSDDVTLAKQLWNISEEITSLR